VLLTGTAVGVGALIGESRKVLTCPAGLCAGEGIEAGTARPNTVTSGPPRSLPLEDSAEVGTGVRGVIRVWRSLALL
jgi:hypothetical protein